MRNDPVGTLQALPRSAARFCLEVERFCREELEMDISGRSLVVAYSGGADSKALLLALHFLSSRLDISLHAAILDHMLREEAVAEVSDAEAFCRRIGVSFHTARRNVANLAKENGMGLEEAGRNARREFLEDIRERTGSAWIAMGHQLNDLAEDALMRMIRGAGWPALGGMNACLPEQNIIRPLLLVSRNSIETFLNDIGESWVNDAMNEDGAYFRNRVRIDILPMLIAENPSYLDSVAERWRMAREDDSLISSLLVPVSYEERKNGMFFPRAALQNVPVSLRLRKYMSVLAAMGEGQVSSALLRNLDAIWLRSEGEKTVQFPGDKRAKITGGGILFFKENGN
jgi:tRNA(Ile)-lysidine synthase